MTTIVRDLREKIQNASSTITLDDLLLTNFPELRQQSGEHYISYEALADIIKLDTEITDQDLEKFKRAYNYAQERHKDDRRKSEGVPFYYHLDRVLLMLSLFGIKREGVDILTAAVLHDVLDNVKENGQRSEIETKIKQDFGPETYSLIEAMSDSHKTSNYLQKRAVKREHLSHMFYHTTNTWNWIIHILDRIDNLRDARQAYSFSTLRMKLEECWLYYLPMAYSLSPVLGQIMEHQLHGFEDIFRPEVLMQCDDGAVLYQPPAYKAYKALSEAIQFEDEGVILEPSASQAGKAVSDTIQLSYSLYPRLPEPETARRIKKPIQNTCCAAFDEDKSAYVVRLVHLLHHQERLSVAYIEELYLSMQPNEEPMQATDELIGDMARIIDRLFPQLEKSTMQQDLYTSDKGNLVYRITIENAEGIKEILNIVEQQVFAQDGIRIAYWYGPKDYTESTSPPICRGDALYYVPQDDKGKTQLLRVVFIHQNPEYDYRSSFG
ncbi:bifunctional (p)ppGpp synthetase/guanosine-3',5'-bis(diphosphate) 3'-pyrophosphohydrolase [Candidatus Woesearchaeota archaeon]|nr:bifunctional (p)ppGpp synthetase/guanosine-3',5'-bis(diphosphate) 3'-pyrophosphohydrolase [Candidatus Woesearchaeota archaeon]